MRTTMLILALLAGLACTIPAATAETNADAEEPLQVGGECVVVDVNALPPIALEDC